MMAMAPSWHGAQMAFLGSLYMDAMGLQMQQSMPPLLPLLRPPPFSLWLCNDAKNKLFAIAFVLWEGIKMNGERGEDDVLLPFLFLKRACMRWLLRNQGNIKFLPSLKQSCLVVINV
jgi:hypothetical protein